MADLETCRCGVELLMTHGAVTRCTHCDGPCVIRPCGFCEQLRNTCNDCGTGHCDSTQARKCEQRHSL